MYGGFEHQLGRYWTQATVTTGGDPQLSRLGKNGEALGMRLGSDELNEGVRQFTVGMARNCRSAYVGLPVHKRTRLLALSVAVTKW
jgi:hypothetical protein